MVETALDRLILEKLGDDTAVFVFPSEVSASAYAGRALLLGNRRAVRMEQFIAWDTFLAEAVLSRVQQLTAVTNVLRKMFAASMLEENARQVTTPPHPSPKNQKTQTVFNTIIRPEYAANSAAFTEWLSGILPQLGAWAQKCCGIPVETIEMPGDDANLNAVYLRLDAEEKDYWTLTVRYKAFLRENGLFESAWERPPFTRNGKNYSLFFTETLADFPLYEDLLKAAAPHAVIIDTPELTGSQKEFSAYFLAGAAGEITAAALAVLNMHKSGTAYRDIIITSPCLEDYEPFILAEFALHGIPVQNGSGKPLGAYPPAMLFQAISDCAAKKMALSSLAALLLNHAIPWKDETAVNRLIAYGRENNCVCSWEYETGGAVDVWEASFLQNPSSIAGFYRSLKRRIQHLCAARTFAEIRDRYFDFRNAFIDMEEFTGSDYESANIVLSRCISELMMLIQIEKKYPRIRVPHAWRFFTGHLNRTIFKMQGGEGGGEGVRLLPYRISAPVPSERRLILGASQNAMSQIFRELSFLSGLKKQRENIEDRDASNVFFRLHRFSQPSPVVFFCSQETFAGFAIPFHGLGLRMLDKKPISLDALVSKDIEHAVFATGSYHEETTRLSAVSSGAPHSERGGVSANTAIFPAQKEGFLAFSGRHAASVTEHAVVSDSCPGIREGIAYRILKDGIPELSPTSLQAYRKCALFWLFRYICRIGGEGGANQELMSPFAKGAAFHDVLSHVFIGIKKARIPFALDPDGELPAVFTGILEKSMDAVFIQASPPEARGGGDITTSAGERSGLQNENALTQALLLPQKDAVREKCAALLKRMFKTFPACTVAETEPDWKESFFDAALIGRPDLILYNPNDENYIIVDFKTGKAPPKKDCIDSGEDGRGIKNFQLPAYKRLAEKKAYTPVNQGVFAAINEVKISAPFDVKGESTALFEAAAEDFDRQFRRFSSEISRMYFEESCTVIYADCLSCDYQAVCRSCFTIQRDKRMGRRRHG